MYVGMNKPNAEMQGSHIATEAQAIVQHVQRHTSRQADASVQQARTTASGEVDVVKAAKQAWRQHQFTDESPANYDTIHSGSARLNAVMQEQHMRHHNAMMEMNADNENCARKAAAAEAATAAAKAEHENQFRQWHNERIAAHKQQQLFSFFSFFFFSSQQPQPQPWQEQQHHTNMTNDVPFEVHMSSGTTAPQSCASLHATDAFATEFQ